MSTPSDQGTVEPITDLAAGARHLSFRFYVPSLLATTGIMMLVPILPLYLQEQTSSVGLVGFVIAAAGIGGMVWNVPGGMLVHRWGEWRGFVAGLGLSAVGPVALAVVGGIWLPFVACLVTGAGQSSRLLARQAYARRFIGSAIRGRLMSLYGGIGRVAMLIGPLIGGLSGEVLGLRPTFAVAAGFIVAGLVAALSGASAGDDRGAMTHATPTAAPMGLRRVAARHGRVIALAGLGQLGVAMIRLGRLTLIPLYGATIGLDVGDIGVVVAIAGGLDLVLFPVAGWVMDRFGRLYAIVPSFAIMSLGLALLPLADSFVGLTAVALVIGLGNGLGSGTMLTLSTDLAPAENPAEFLGLLRILSDLGRILGPVAVGLVADQSDLGTSSLVLAAVGVATALLFALAIGEPTRTDEPSARP